ncbi:flavin reductase family protein [Hansschlegelia quercus]|uniref:flavin reductase family protein n=1 Tax=Hansschlegelia quercus TaxID=2528245 RepID=UPI00197A756F|nr:flavin reductase family protein [Hansschlegelia quercus]
MTALCEGSAIEVEPSAFRLAAGCFPTGVSIVTAEDEQGERVGVTANSFVSVSLQPPLVSVALARSLASIPVFERASHFAISVLGEGDETLAARFASRGANKWSDTLWEPGLRGAPLIEGAVATFECERYALHDGGDHRILLGRVISLASAPTLRPLIFHRGAFARLAAPLPREQRPGA